jgi:SSS family solute:Na+ symporter
MAMSPGLRGFIVAILLAALMSTLSAMINVTSSVVVNDFLKRYLVRGLPERALVRLGQAASVLALVAGFGMARLFSDVVTIWEGMVFSVVTVILVPATLRWHWWRFGARAFSWSIAASTVFIVGRVILVRSLAAPWPLLIDMTACLAITLAIAPLFPPAPLDALVRFYARVRPFGFWGPVRREAVRRGLVPERDPMPAIDIANGFLTAGFQFAMAACPFHGLLGRWNECAAWTAAAAVLGIVLYFTWYRNLPARDEADPAGGGDPGSIN